MISDQDKSLEVDCFICKSPSIVSTNFMYRLPTSERAFVATCADCQGNMTLEEWITHAAEALKEFEDFLAEQYQSLDDFDEYNPSEELEILDHQNFEQEYNIDFE